MKLNNNLEFFKKYSSINKVDVTEADNIITVSTSDGQISLPKLEWIDIVKSLLENTLFFNYKEYSKLIAGIIIENYRIAPAFKNIGADADSAIETLYGLVDRQGVIGDMIIKNYKGELINDINETLKSEGYPELVESIYSNSYSNRTEKLIGWYLGTCPDMVSSFGCRFNRDDLNELRESRKSCTSELEENKGLGIMIDLVDDILDEYLKSDDDARYCSKNFIRILNLITIINEHLGYFQRGLVISSMMAKSANPVFKLIIDDKARLEADVIFDQPVILDTIIAFYKGFLSIAAHIELDEKHRFNNIGVVVDELDRVLL